MSMTFEEHKETCPVKTGTLKPSCQPVIDINTELTALRDALRMMHLDPNKVAAFVTKDGDYVCKASLFGCVGLDETKLIARVGENANLEAWRNYWHQLSLSPEQYPEKK